MSGYAGGCPQALRAFKVTNPPDCCPSCHTDMEYDFPGCEVELDGRWFEVCCTLTHEIEEARRTQGMHSPGIYTGNTGGT